MHAAPNPNRCRRVRAGNALVLVTAILVLLVIIATAFLSRSRAVRAQAAATQQASGRDVRVESVCRDLAQGLADALFVRRIDESTYPFQVQANAATGLSQPGLGQFFARSDFPLLPPYPFAVRYEVDMFDGGTAGFDNRFLGPYVALGQGESVSARAKVDGYNYAPFVVAPFTNWPLRYGEVQGETDFRDWFRAPAAAPGTEPPSPYPQNFRIPTNPRGNPGFGDHRWLASTEPVRAQVEGIDVTESALARAKAFPLLLENGAAKITADGIGFSHWPHLSWIANANNGFRVCWDISDLDLNTLEGGAGTAEGELALGTPYEQWLPWSAPRELGLVSGWTDPEGYLAINWKDFRWRWANWFNRVVPPIAGGLGRPNDVLPPITSYPAAAGGQAGNTGHMQVIKGVNLLGDPVPTRRADAPPNFLQLAAYGPPADEFKVYTAADAAAARIPGGYAVGDPKPRNVVGRTLADADGDGWTDSLWFAAPTSTDRGTRQVVAVRIMDNSALLNVNVATRFERGNSLGQTPADLALVSRRESYDLSQAPGRAAAAFDYPVGFLSAPENDPEWRTNEGDGKVAILPTRTPGALPPVADPYGGGWTLLNSQFTNGGGDPASVNSSNYFAVYRTSGSQAIEVAFAPERFEGRRARGNAEDGSSLVNTVTLPGYFGRQSLLGELGVIREGRFGAPNSANTLLPDFSIGDDFGTPSPNGDFFALSRVADRSTYFKAMQNGGAIIDPVISARRAELTPFGIDDEVELRAFNGCNDPQTVSRLEAAMGGTLTTEAGQARPLDQFLRGTRSREETSRFLPALDPRQQDSGVRRAYLTGSFGADRAARSGTELLLDHRRKLTTVSGARNDLLPPRLWTVMDYSDPIPENYRFLTARPAYDAARLDDGTVLLPPYDPNRMFPDANPIPAGPDNPWGRSVVDVDGNGKAEAADFLLARQRFLLDNRKIDLRRPVDDAAPLDSPQTPNRDDRFAAVVEAQRRFTWDIQRVFNTALIDSSTRASGQAPDSLFSRPGAAVDERTWAAAWTKAMSASFAANLLCYRDSGRPTVLLPGQVPVVADQPLFPSTYEGVQWPNDTQIPEAIRESIGGQVQAQQFGFIGVEAHPVIMEVFVAAVYPPNKLELDEVEAAWEDYRDTDPNAPADCPLTDTHFDEDDYRLAKPDWPAEVAKPAESGKFNASFDPTKQEEFLEGGGAPAFVLVVQVANPFNVPVKLGEYELRIHGSAKDQNTNQDIWQSFQFGKNDRWCDSATQDQVEPFNQGEIRWGNTYGPDVELGPCTPEEPRTAIVFAIPETFPNGLRFPREEWLDFFDLGVSVDQNADSKARSDLSDLGGNLNAQYPRGSADFFPAGRWFQPDQVSLFRPAWGNDADTRRFKRGGTLLFDATIPVSVPSSGGGGPLVRKYTPRGASGSGFRVVPQWNANDPRFPGDVDIRLWEPRSGSGPAGRRSWIELVRKVRSSDGSSANVVVDRFENQVDPASNLVRSGPLDSVSDSAGGSQANRGSTFLSLLQRTLPSATDPTRSAQSAPPATSVRFRAGGSSGSYKLLVDGTRFLDPDSLDETKITQVQLEALDASNRYPLSCFVTWARGARQWLVDVDGDGQIAADERTPRFAFSQMASLMGSALLSSSDPENGDPDGGAREVNAPWGDSIVGDAGSRRQFGAAIGTLFAPDRESLFPGSDPSRTWWSHMRVAYRNAFDRPIRNSKPVFLSTRAFDDGANRLYPRQTTAQVDGNANSQWWKFFSPPADVNGTTSYGEKGATDARRTARSRGENFNAPFRLFAKGADLDQIAEIFDVPMWGPLVGFLPPPNNPLTERPTFITLSEVLSMPQNHPPGWDLPSQSGGSAPAPVASLLMPMSARSVLSDDDVQVHWMPHNAGNPQGPEIRQGPRFGSWQQQVSWNRLSIAPATYTRLENQELNALGGGANPDRLNIPTQLSGNQVLPTAFSKPGSVPLPQQNGIGFNSRLPAATVLLDAFTLDDRGATLLDSNSDNSISPTEWGGAEDRRLRLANGFSGQRTNGLVNINTAPVEVLRAMPHLTRFGYFDDFPIRVTSDSNPTGLAQPATVLGQNRLIRDPRLWERSPAQRAVLGEGTSGNASPFPTVRVASAIESYRNKLNPVVLGSADDPDGRWTYPESPSYVDRGLQLGDQFKHREFAPAMRPERGFESLGELALLVRGSSGIRGDEDSNNNSILDVREIASGLAVDFNQNGIPDPTHPIATNFQTDWDAPPSGSAPWNWGGATSWSIRYGGFDPYRTSWSSDRGGLGARSDPIRTDAALPGYYTQGVPLAGGGGKEFTLGGRTAIDPHLLVAATDDPISVSAASGGVETDDARDPWITDSGSGQSSQVLELAALRFDRTSGDALEQNQLLRGISNLVTTRSDVFTMWVRVRTIRQDPLTGKWNAMDPDSILDDSRYVMTIDRSNVDRPGDAPRILGMVKVPK